MREDEVFEISDAVALRETDKAILVEAPIFDEEQWVPKSQIHDDSEVWGAKRGRNVGSLIVTMWIAQQKGWSDE